MFPGPTLSYGPKQHQGSMRHVPGQGGRRPLEGRGGEPDVLSSQRIIEGRSACAAALCFWDDGLPAATHGWRGTMGTSNDAAWQRPRER